MSNPSYLNIDLWLFELKEGNLSEFQIEQLQKFLLNHPEFDVDKDMWEKVSVAQNTERYEKAEELKRPAVIWFPYAASITLVAIISSFSYYVLTSTKSFDNVRLADSKNINELKTNPNSTQTEVSSTRSSEFLNDNSIQSETSNSELIASTITNHLDFGTTEVIGVSNQELVLNDEGYVDRLGFNELTGVDLDRPNSIEKIKIKEERSKSHKSSSFWSKVSRNLNKMANNSIGLKNYRSPSYNLPGMIGNEINFGNTGSAMNFRAQSLSRLQWFGESNENVINKLSFDGYVFQLKGGLGVDLEHNYYNNGGINKSQLAITYSPKLRVSKNVSFEPSVRFKMGNKNLTSSKMAGIDQVELERGIVTDVLQNEQFSGSGNLWYKDLGLGALVNTKWFFAGIQIDNVLRHNENMFSSGQQNREDLHLIVSAGTDWVSNRKKLGVSPYLIYQNKGPLSELWAGFNLRYNWFVVGASVSSNLEPTASLGLKFSKIEVKYSADYLRNGIVQSNQLSHQITLKFSTKPGRHGKALLNL